MAYFTTGAGLPGASLDQMFKPLALTVALVHAIVATLSGDLLRLSNKIIVQDSLAGLTLVIMRLNGVPLGGSAQPYFTVLLP